MNALKGMKLCYKDRDSNKAWTANIKASNFYYFKYLEAKLIYFYLDTYMEDSFKNKIGFV